MDEENVSTIYCSRCGAEMKDNSRYCMKCGNLNYDHEENEKFKYLQPKEEQQLYQVGSGNTVFASSDMEKQDVYISINKNNGKTCFLVNYILYLVIAIFSLFYFVHGEYTLESILYSVFPIFIIVLSLFFLYFYAVQMIFVKSDEKWWYALIPIYNCMILSDIAFHNKYLGLLLLVPFVGLVFSFALFYQLGRKFKYNAIITMLFPFIMILFIGFGIHAYEGHIYINFNDKKSVEKYYKYRKVFLLTVLLGLFMGIMLFIFSDISALRKKFPFFGDDYYIYVAEKVVQTTKNNVEAGKVSCDGSIMGKGVYYFDYNDVGDSNSLLFYIFHDPIKASVLVDTTEDKAKYSIMLTDGKKGFSYIPAENLSVYSITSADNIIFENHNVGLCYATK